MHRNKLITIFVHLLVVASACADFSDDFQRANGTVIGNGWTETTTDSRFDPQIENDVVSWKSIDGFPNWARAGIRRELEPADMVKVDLAWWTDTPVAQDNRMEFNAVDGANNGIQVRVFSWDASGNYIKVTVNYKGMDYWTMCQGLAQDFHTYRIEVNDNGQSRLYIDNIQRWASADGGIGQVTSVKLDVVREFWEWNWFKADNFLAYTWPGETIAINALTQQEFTPANHYGTGVQAAYPEHGFSDAMDAPVLFDELAEVLGRLHTKIIRFPGGTWAHYYSIHGPESMDAIAKLEYAYILNRNTFGWSDTRRYFELCKAVGADALYQLNMKFVYDPITQQAYAIDSQTLPLAVADARQIALWAKQVGVKVFWEFGNEDYTFLTTTQYVSLCHHLYNAIKQVDPSAQFVICGDGFSWSDWTWAYGVLDEMAEAGMTDMAYTSHHVYLTGGSSIAMDNGQNTYDGIRDGWNNLKFLHLRIRDKLDRLGYTQTKVALTEGNVGAPPSPIVGAEWEHGMGRALGEASIFPDRIQRFAMLIHHDLVRNSEPAEVGTWFTRIYYYPNNPTGSRYQLPLDAEVMKVVYEHALRQIIYNNWNGITVSQWNDGLLVTAGNPLGESRKIVFQFGNVANLPEQMTVTCIRAENLDTEQFTVTQIPAELVDRDGQIVVEVVLPKYSFCYFRTAMIGDTNNDGLVDVGDLGVLAANYGGIGKVWSQGDFNGDGTVDVGDLGILAANYGTNASNSDWVTDYNKAFGLTVQETHDADENSFLVCSGLGFPLIAGLLLAGLMLVKLDKNVV